MLRTLSAAVALLLVAATASAQSERPAFSLDDPSCEEAPDQAGCDPACAGEADCDHPPCPTGLAGHAPPSGGIFMSWTLNSFSDVKVYRAQAGGDFEEVAYLEFPTTRWLDHDTEAGATYRYQVTAVGSHQYNSTVAAEGESPPCGTFEAASVPVFPSLAAALAVGGVAVAGYTVLRRRT